jgi:hypothetical protein
LANIEQYEVQKTFGILFFLFTRNLGTIG